MHFTIAKCAIYDKKHFVCRTFHRAGMWMCRHVNCEGEVHGVQESCVCLTELCVCCCRTWNSTCSRKRVTALSAFWRCTLHKVFCTLCRISGDLNCSPWINKKCCSVQRRLKSIELSLTLAKVSTLPRWKKVERRSLVKKSLLSAAGEASHATHETESEGFFFKRKSDRKSLRTSQSKGDFIGRECGEEVRTTWIKKHHINQLINLLEFCILQPFLWNPVVPDTWKDSPFMVLRKLLVARSIILATSSRLSPPACCWAKILVKRKTWRENRLRLNSWVW